MRSRWGFFVLLLAVVGLAAAAVAALGGAWHLWLLFGVVLSMVFAAANSFTRPRFARAKRTIVRDYDRPLDLPKDPPPALRTVVVGISGSKTSGKALAAAIDVAERNGSRLVIVSAYQPAAEGGETHGQDAPLEVEWADNPTAEVDAVLARAAGRARARGLEVTTVASQGRPAEVLCRYATEHDADVLVVGNKGVRRRVLGSVPNTVAQNAPCWVLIVKTT